MQPLPLSTTSSGPGSQPILVVLAVVAGHDCCCSQVDLPQVFVMEVHHVQGAERLPLAGVGVPLAAALACFFHHGLNGHVALLHQRLQQTRPVVKYGVQSDESQYKTLPTEWPSCASPPASAANTTRGEECCAV